MENIVDDIWIDQFFSLVGENNILRRRESATIEFKETFDWVDRENRSNYAKTCAAFSNNKGGIIFFGIKDKPHELVGITNFNEIDDADISNYLSELFTPRIEFERKEIEINSMKIGLMQVFESTHKPIICKKESHKTRPSDIYFRYSGKSEKIKAGDLMILCEIIRKKEAEKWMNLFQNVAKIGVSNVGILNTGTGDLKTDKNTFLLDETLLSQIKFINKYSKEEKGSPAVKIIGEITGVTSVITKSKTIYEEDVFEAFLKTSPPNDSENYFKAILHFKSSNFPIYFYLREIEGNRESAIEYLENLSIRTNTYEKILDRVKNQDGVGKKYQLFSLTSKQYGKRREELYQNLINQENFEITSELDAKLLLESIFSLSDDNLNIEFTKNMLNYVFKNYYPFENHAPLNYTFRDTLAYIDYLQYRFK